jgi:hypothetical protein
LFRKSEAKHAYVTIRPTARSLVRGKESAPPNPVFVLEWNQQYRPGRISVDLAAEPGAFLTRSTEHFEIQIPDSKSQPVEWEVPADAWRRLANSSRVYYRATAWLDSRRTITSTENELLDELPFLHGLPSDGFYIKTTFPTNLPQLHVEGATLLRADTPSPFILRGVNVSGLNHARYFHAPSGRWCDAADITPALLDRLRDMQVNVIRLPLNQDWLLMGYHEPELPEYHQTQVKECLSYLEDIDKIVAWAAEREMYVILSLHTFRLSAPAAGFRGSEFRGEGDSLEARMNVESMKQPYNAHLPDDRSWLFWSVLVHRYRGCTAVLFDLCNEPHEVQKWYGDSHEYRGKLPPASIERSRTDGREYRAWWLAQWKAWASALEELVHTLNPEALVFISGFGGPNWSSSLEEMDYRSPTGNPNVILAVHWYWSNSLGPGDWRRHLGLGHQPVHPVFVAEWGVETPGAIANEAGDGAPGQDYLMHWGRRPVPAYATLTSWGEALADFFIDLTARGAHARDSGFAGFAAWSTGDKPRIFKREKVHSGPYEAGFPLTDYGRIVQKLLAKIEALGCG